MAAHIELVQQNLAHLIVLAPSARQDAVLIEAGTHGGSADHGLFIFNIVFQSNGARGAQAGFKESHEQKYFSSSKLLLAIALGAITGAIPCRRMRRRPSSPPFPLWLARQILRIWLKNRGRQWSTSAPRENCRARKSSRTNKEEDFLRRFFGGNTDQGRGAPEQKNQEPSAFPKSVTMYRAA